MGTLRPPPPHPFSLPTTPFDLDKYQEPFMMAPGIYKC